MGVFCGYFRDPVFLSRGFWFYWDRVWTTAIGPFANEHSARESLNDYLRRIRMT